MRKATWVVATTTEGSARFVGRTAAGVVAQMRRTQWNAPERKRQYMDEVRERVHQMTEQWINIATPEDFLRALEKLGLMRVEWTALLH